LQTGRFAPQAGGPQYGGGDHELKSPNKLGPRPLVFRASTRPY
jgi:hypothetical protein